MAQRMTGGGERYIGQRSITLTGISSASVRIAAGANLMRIQPQLFSTATAKVLVQRNDEPTVAVNEMALGHCERAEDVCRGSRDVWYFALVDASGAQKVGGIHDRIQLTFYTNAAGRL